MTGRRQRSRAKRIARVPPHRRVDVTRAEFNQIIDLLNERGAIINGLVHNQEIQFTRIAQLQAEIDALRAARTRTPRS